MEEQIISIRPFLALLVSLAVIPAIISSSKRPNLREAWTLLASFAKFGLVLSMLPAVLEGHRYVYTLLQVTPGVALRFEVDGLGMLFALVASFLWIITSFYSVGYMRGLNEHGQTRYYCFFALSLFATIGVAFSANLLTLYMFYEIITLSTYPLVTHHQDQEARSAGRRYLAFLMGTSIGLVLPAMLICYNLTGTLEFTSGGILAGEASKTLITVLLFLFLFGFAKAAIMPLHSWLPTAMVAPTTVSALLHAVAVVKAGVFSIVRVLTGTFGVELLSSLNLGPIVAYIAAVTILVGSLIAMSQDDLKRLLAFSTVSQLSYIVLGTSLLSPQAMIGGIIHIVMHAFGKITLFLCAGAIAVATGKKRINEMDGIGKIMPLTMSAFLIGALSVIGLPPCGGFISKWFLVLGTLEAHNFILLIVILTSSLLNAVYFLPIVFRAFFRMPQQSNFKNEGQKEPPWCVIPLLLTAIGSIILFFYPHPFIKLIEVAVQTGL